MNKYSYIILLVVSFTLIAFVAACASPTPTPIPTPVTIAAPAPTSTPPSPPTATPTATPTPTRTSIPSPTPAPTAATPNARQLADAGKNVFSKYCARCHGEKGEGLFAPTVIGRGSNLEKYNSARGLMAFISSAMPMDAPGSLSQQEYIQVLSFLLVQNGLTKPETIIDSSQLGQIQFKKISVESNDDNGRGRGRGRGSDRR